MTSSANAEPKGSEPSSTERCVCGHPQVNHHWRAAHGEGCIGNRNLCRCRMFRRQEEPDRTEECSGICLTPADIGLPEYGGPGVVAYSHPDCPQHGDPSEPEPPMTPEEEEQAPEDTEWSCANEHGCTRLLEDACHQGCRGAADELTRLGQETEPPPPQPERRPPLLVSYSVQGHLYEVALSGDASVRAVDGALVIQHALGPIAGICQVVPFSKEESP